MIRTVYCYGGFFLAYQRMLKTCPAAPPCIGNYYCNKDIDKTFKLFAFKQGVNLPA